jgi:hypothetical protein
MSNILNISFPRRLDTLKEIQYGAMGSKTVRVDILQKQYEYFEFDYKNNYERYTHLDNDISFLHTEKFMEKYFDSENNKVVSDMFFDSLDRPTLYYKEIIPHRRSSSFFLNSIICEAEIYGRNDLFAGDVLRLNLPEYINTTDEKRTHRSLSGYWLVNQIIHILEGKEYKCRVSLSKDLPRNEGVD